MEVIFHRKTQQRAATLHVMGHVTLAAIFGDQSVPAQSEQKVLQLAVDTTYQQRLQDPVTGNSYFIAGLDDPGDTTKIVR